MSSQQQQRLLVEQQQQPKRRRQGRRSVLPRTVTTTRSLLPKCSSYNNSRRQQRAKEECYTTTRPPPLLSSSSSSSDGRNGRYLYCYHPPLSLLQNHQQQRSLHTASSSISSSSSSSSTPDDDDDDADQHSTNTNGRRQRQQQKNQKQEGQPDYWTNSGIIEGVWMFSRHGDRTPSRPLSPEHRRNDEAAFWMTKLPVPDSATAFESYSKYYPFHQIQASQHPTHHSQNEENKSNQGTFIDVARNPFGFLTSRGLQELAENGQRFFKRYNNYAHHIPGCPCWKSPQDFLNAWNVQVYSTNYLRTIMSVQSFLDGMFATHCYEPILRTHHRGERTFDPTIIKEERIPTIRAANNNNNRSIVNDNEENALVQIHVRDVRNDPLNAFDRNPDLIADLVSEVMKHPDFFQRDGLAAPLAARLANILPGLARRRNQQQQQQRRRNSNTTAGPQDLNTKSNDFTSRAPSGINWVEAADHFVCRKAHNLPLAKFTDFELDDRVEQTLQAMSNSTLAHLSWRFRKWYQHERLLALIAAPPLREITTQMLRTPQLSKSDKHPFVIYSCHDITILGLLYAIGADFLAYDDDSDIDHTSSGNDSGSWRYWPPYGSNLVFELVRISPEEEEGDGDGENRKSQPQHVIRVLLNGSPVRSAKINPPSALGWDIPKGGPEGMFSLPEWEDVIRTLEKDGGHNYDSFF